MHVYQCCPLHSSVLCYLVGVQRSQYATLPCSVRRVEKVLQTKTCQLPWCACRLTLEWNNRTITICVQYILGFVSLTKIFLSKQHNAGQKKIATAQPQHVQKSTSFLDVFVYDAMVSAAASVLPSRACCSCLNAIWSSKTMLSVVVISL